MASAWSDRLGLHLLTATGDRHEADDHNAHRRAVAALGAWLLSRLGGEGLHAGGAAVVGDLTGGGTQYPACTLVIADDSGWPWWFRTTSAKAISGLDAIEDGTATTLYAVVKQLAGTSPAAASGGLADVTFQALPTASAAPAHSLALGAGTVTGNAFADWTPAAAPGPLLAANGLTVTGTTTLGSLSGVLKATAGVVAGGATAADVGADAAGTGASEAAAAVDAHETAYDHAGYDSHLAATGNVHGATAADVGAVAASGNETIAGVKTFSSAPVLDSLTAARLLATGAGKAAASVADLTSWIAGTANQVTVANDGDGTVTLSGPQDLHTAAAPTFAGLTLNSTVYTVAATAPVSPAHGDRWYDTTLLVEWAWSATYSRWMTLLAEQAPLPYWGTVTYPVSTGVTLGNLPLSTLYDWIVESITWACDANAGTWDSGNKWTLRCKQGSNVVVDIEKATPGYTTLLGVPGSAALGLFDTTTHRTIQFDMLKTGSPGTIIASAVSVVMRKAHV